MTSKAEKLKVGDVLGRLTITHPPALVGRYLKVNVRCECGEAFLADHNNVRHGRTRSCGCLNKEMVQARATTHGLSKSPIYAVWNVMLQRCTNPGNKQWPDYGGRGITVCKRWLEFESFYADMGAPPFKGAMLDRENNDKGYSKANCRWVTRKVQNNNKRNTRRWPFQGQLLPMADIAEILGVPAATLVSRIYLYGWTPERAFTSERFQNQFDSGTTPTQPTK